MKAATSEDPVVNPQIETPPPSTTPTTTDIFNKLIAALLPVLNTAIVNAIKQGGGDPFPEVIVPPDGTWQMVEFEIPFVCKSASLTAAYTVKNMKGLSSLVITSMTAQTIPEASQKVTASNSKEPRLLTGKLSVKAKLSKNLTATVGGSLKAACDKSTAGFGLAGQAIAKTVTGTAKGDFTMEVSYKKSCLKVLKLNNFHLNYADIDVDVPGDYGIYDAMLNPLWDEIDEEYGSEIKNEISKAVEPELNTLLKSLLPLCIDPVTGKRI